MANEEKKPTENAVPEAVNGQITDETTQNNVRNVPEAPALALGNVYQTAAHSTGIMFENSVNNQNQLNILGQAAGIQGVIQIYNTDTVNDAISIANMMNPNLGNRPPQNRPLSNDKDKK